MTPSPFLSGFRKCVCLVALVVSTDPGCLAAATDHKAIIAQIVVSKSDHLLIAYDQMGEPSLTYHVALGRVHGRKSEEGDNKTPEGVYFVVAKRVKDRFYKAMKINYPNADDKTSSDLNRKYPGSDIMIHGLPRQVSFLGQLGTMIDWTSGCIALSNSDMGELYERTPIGTPVIIYNSEPNYFSTMSTGMPTVAQLKSL